MQNTAVGVFDLERFREVAFGRGGQPDHPLRTVADAKKAVEELPAADPHSALAELTALVKTMNETDAFKPERRVDILFELDDAARRLWKVLGSEHLAPGGTPGKGEGNLAIPRAFFDSASEFTEGFAITLDHPDIDRKQLDPAKLARVYLRNMRWLAKRLVLAHMLRLPVTGAIWEKIHRRYGLAQEDGVATLAQPVYEGNRSVSSSRQEYIRCLLLELAGPDSLPGRQVELAFRVTGRVASAVHIDDKRSDSTVFAVVPMGDSRPMLAAALAASAAPAPLYIDATLTLPKLRAGLERDMGRDPKDADTLYVDYTLAERFAMMKRLLEHWGMDPPQRRTRRVAMAAPARLIHQHESVANVLPAFSRGVVPDKPLDLQLKIDDTTATLTRAKLRAANRVGPARVIDGSNGGLGLAVRPQDAKWAVHDALVGVLIEPGNDWVVGVIRRIFSIDQELRLGIQVLSTRAQVVVLSTDTTMRRDSVWEEAIKFEATYRERYRKGILLSPTPGVAEGDALLEPGLATQGTQFDVFLADGPRRVRVARVLHSGATYQRVMLEPMK